MQSISCKIEENYINTGKVTFVDFSIIGFKTSKDNKILDFYYLFNDDEKEFYIIKNSFLMDKNKIDDEMAYLNHPIHETININKYDQYRSWTVSKIMSNCNSGNSFYSEFIAEEIINNEIVICNAVQYNLSQKQQLKQFVIPIKIYMKLQIIKNSVLFKLPINPSIDRDIFKNIKIKKVNSVDYIGSEFYNNKGFINYYSLKNSDDTITGIFLTVNDTNKKLFKKNISLKQFSSLYKDYFQLDMRNLLILDWIDKDSNKKQFVTLYKSNIENNTLIFYITNDSMVESIISNPYKYI